jgi:hypothetical protein
MLKSGILAISVLLFGASVRAEDVTPKDYDLACAVVASIELAQMPNRDTTDWWSVFSELSFYLGRLTVRDNHASWRHIIAGRVAERHNQPNPPGAVDVCLDLFNKTIEGK